MTIGTSITTGFALVPDVAPPQCANVSDVTGDVQSLVALRIETKLEFRDLDGEVHHRYLFPSDRDIQNCGGYIDKLLKYRDPRLIEYVLSQTPDLGYFRASPFPVLTGRSPHIDLILNELIPAIRAARGGGRVSLLDHGCTLAEHFDLLDLLFRASGRGAASEMLTYIGLDVSPLVLCAARLFHEPLLGEHFKLILSEGSDLQQLPDDSIDCSISVGVVNHVARPLEALEHLIRITRGAFVTAIWATSEPEGFWAFNHSGYSNYFFSTADLRRLARRYAKGRFCFAEDIPEQSSSQPNSYVGLSAERLEKMRSYILIYTGVEPLPPGLATVEF